MKIYVDSKYYTNKHMDIIINNNLIINKNIINEFYTYNGIFRLINDNFYKSIIHDGEKIKINHNNINFTIDKTTISFPINFNNMFYQLPFNHHNNKFTEYKILLRPKALISLNIHINNYNDIIDWFFTTNEEFDTIKEDIDEFLSML